jgi:hypothetical protein
MAAPTDAPQRGMQQGRLWSTAILGWLHWLLVLAMLVLWLARGRPSGGDVLWYYVIGFVPAWVASAVAVLWAYLRHLRRSPADRVGPSAFSVAMVGLVSPMVVLWL